MIHIQQNMNLSKIHRDHILREIRYSVYDIMIDFIPSDLITLMLHHYYLFVKPFNSIK